MRFSSTAPLMSLNVSQVSTHLSVWHTCLNLYNVTCAILATNEWPLPLQTSLARGEVGDRGAGQLRAGANIVRRGRRVYDLSPAPQSPT